MFSFGDNWIIFLLKGEIKFCKNVNKIKPNKKIDNNLPMCIAFGYAKNSFCFVESIIDTGYKRAGVDHNFVCFNIIC